MPFNLTGIVAIIMDAVAIECERGIAKQHHFGGHDFFDMIPPLADERGQGWRGPFGRVLTVDDVMLFPKRGRACTPHLVAHSDKAERAGATSLERHVLDR